MVQCKVCRSEENVINLPLYVNGSEGVDLCLQCRMVLTEVTQGMIRSAFTYGRGLIKDFKKIREGKGGVD